MPCTWCGYAYLWHPSYPQMHENCRSCSRSSCSVFILLFPDGLWGRPGNFFKISNPSPLAYCCISFPSQIHLGLPDVQNPCPSFFFCPPPIMTLTLWLPLLCFFSLTILPWHFHKRLSDAAQLWPAVVFILFYFCFVFVFWQCIVLHVSWGQNVSHLGLCNFV